MKTLKKLLLLSAIAGLLAVALSVGIASAAPPATRNYVAHLSGDDAGAETLGQGQAIFHFSKDGSQLEYKLIVANIENVTMAHIHVAEQPGADGPPVLWLYPDAPPPALVEDRLQGVLSTGVATGADLVGPLAGETLEVLKTAIEEGRAYVNVHTTQYPPGEIRGTIR